MSVLNVDIPTMSLGDIIGIQATQVMAIHENRHAIPLGCRSGWSPCELLGSVAVELDCHGQFG
jgi:hypothetical protein